MNRRLALQKLVEFLERYSDFIFHKEFLTDIKQLLHDISGHEDEFFALLIKQLSFVRDLGINVKGADSNELLKHVTNFACYSLHLQSKNFNIRILMTFDNLTPLFLTAFYERFRKK